MGASTVGRPRSLGHHLRAVRFFGCVRGHAAVPSASVRCRATACAEYATAGGLSRAQDRPYSNRDRVVGGVALLVLASAAQAAGLVSGLQSYEFILGLVLLLAASVAAGLLARHPARGQLRFTGSTGITVNLLIILVLFAVPYTADGAALFYGTSLLLAAWRAQPGCEA
jgi:hypothetical protein